GGKTLMDRRRCVRRRTGPASAGAQSKLRKLRQRTIESRLGGQNCELQCSWFFPTFKVDFPVPVDGGGVAGAKEARGWTLPIVLAPEFFPIFGPRSESP